MKTDEQNLAFKEATIAQLQRAIVPLQGLRALTTDNNINLGFRAIENAFPNAVFPVGCTHKFLSASEQDSSATIGFVAVMLSKLMQFQGAAIWISTSRTLFPGALKGFGVNPDKKSFL